MVEQRPVPTCCFDCTKPVAGPSTALCCCTLRCTAPRRCLARSGPRRKPPTDSYRPAFCLRPAGLQNCLGRSQVKSRRRFRLLDRHRHRHYHHHHRRRKHPNQRRWCHVRVNELRRRSRTWRLQSQARTGRSRLQLLAHQRSVHAIQTARILGPGRRRLGLWRQIHCRLHHKRHKGPRVYHFAASSR